MSDEIMQKRKGKRERSDLRTGLDALADEVTGFIHSLCPPKALCLGLCCSYTRS